ncbi:MAG: hypothetical protein JNM72_27405 [Deltaproteobacteria bacterium]|nr:hypothetical protein [Deltaproteobacteria bacterium]
MPRRPAAAPTPEQVAAARGVAKWYLERYHGTADDVGVVTMFADPARVGAFASPLEAIRAGEPGALFRLLVATTMFQRRQDLQIMRVLQGISAEDAAELTDIAGLRRAAQACGCPHATSLAGLIGACDLHKDDAGVGACVAAPEVRCLPKRHAVLLKRYGHFGKVPTGLAHAVIEAGADDLRALKDRCVAEAAGPAGAAEALEGALRRAWRVSDKIAAMFLSMLSNPDLSPGLSPWSDGLDWGRWVVIDSNVDLFLARVGYVGLGTYGARRAFIEALAAEIDLSQLKPGLQSYNPRVLQQALYLFMSVTNRRALDRDCSRVEGACERCPVEVAGLCGLRRC